MSRKRTYCSVAGCGSKSTSTNLTFFSLPIDAERRKKWLKLIKRPDLDRSDVKPKSYCVCALHFADSDITRQEIVKLQPKAIPSKFIDGTDPPLDTFISTNFKRKKMGPLNSRNISTQTDDTWRIAQPDTPSTSTSATLQSKEKSKSQNSETSEDAVTKRNMTVGFYKLIQWQISLKNKFKGDYNSAEFKKFALNLYYSSPSIYRSLKTFLKLPDEKALARSNLNLKPGLDDWILKSISSKLQSLPAEARYCTVCIGEMPLKRHLYYDIKHDEITGLHNMYGEVSNEIASTAYAVMLRGIAVHWDLPIAYAFVSPNDDQLLYIWIDNIITKLLSMDIRVIAVVTEETKQFEKYAKEIKNITSEKPYFTVNDTKIYFIFDVPDLLKHLRNHLLSHDFYTPKLDRITWEYINKLYLVQKEQNLQLLPKITDAHITPDNFDKKEIKLAAQVFSLSVFGALNTLISSKMLPGEAQHTAEFVKLMNDLFDVLNSSNMDNKSTTIKENQIDILDSALIIFQSLTAIDRETSTYRDIPTFENFRISIQAIKSLKKQDIKHVVTQRFSQEPVENWFNEIRLQKTDGRDPRPIQFRRAFSKFFNSKMIQDTSLTDCHEDLYDLILRGDKIISKTMIAFDNGISFIEPPSVIQSLDGEADYRFDLPSDGTATYVAAYILYKCSQKHRCPKLTSYMNSRMSLYDFKKHPNFKDFNKNDAFYDFLKLPPEYFVTHVKKLEKIFLEKFEKFTLKNPASTLLTLLHNLVFDFPCPCFPVHYFIKLFIRFRIYNVIKTNDKCLRGDKNLINIKTFQLW